MRDLSRSLAASVAIQLCGMTSGIALAQLLLPAGRGQLAAVMLWPSLVASIGFLGIADATAFFAARNRAACVETLTAAAVLAAVLSLPLVAAGAGLVPLVHAGQAAPVRGAAYLYLAFIPLTLFNTFLAAQFQGALRFGEWNLLRTLPHVLYAIGVALVWAAGLGSVMSFAAASLAANAATLAAVVALAARRRWLGGRLRLAVVRGMVRYGLTVHLGFLLNLAGQRLDQALIALVLAAADFGLYVVAMTLAGAAVAIANTIGPIAFPKIAAQPTDAGKTVVFGRYLRALVYLYLPLAGTIVALAPWLLGWLFGEEFRAAAPVARVLIVGAAFLSLKAMLAAALKACDRALAIGRAELVGVAVLVVALAALLPALGIVGAALAQAGAAAVSASYMGWRLRRDLGIALVPLFRPAGEDWRILAAGLRGLGR